MCSRSWSGPLLQPPARDSPGTDSEGEQPHTRTARSHDPSVRIDRVHPHRLNSNPRLCNTHTSIGRLRPRAIDRSIDRARRPSPPCLASINSRRRARRRRRATTAATTPPCACWLTEWRTAAPTTAAMRRGRGRRCCRNCGRRRRWSSRDRARPPARYAAVETHRMHASTPIRSINPNHRRRALISQLPLPPHQTVRQPGRQQPRLLLRRPVPGHADGAQAAPTAAGVRTEPRLTPPFDQSNNQSNGL